MEFRNSIRGTYGLIKNSWIKKVGVTTPLNSFFEIDIIKSNLLFKFVFELKNFKTPKTNPSITS